MMYGDPAFEGKLKWLTFGTAIIPQWGVYIGDGVGIYECSCDFRNP